MIDAAKLAALLDELDDKLDACIADQNIPREARLEMIGMRCKIVCALTELREGEGKRGQPQVSFRSLLPSRIERRPRPNEYQTWEAFEKHAQQSFEQCGKVLLWTPPPLPNFDTTPPSKMPPEAFVLNAMNAAAERDDAGKVTHYRISERHYAPGVFSRIRADQVIAWPVVAWPEETLPVVPISLPAEDAAKPADAEPERKITWKEFL